MGVKIVVFAWFEKLGFNSNPLSIKPLQSILGREKELELLCEHIFSGNIALLSGEAGIGKTSLLLALEKKLSKNKGFNSKYLSLLNGSIDFKKACPKNGFVESFLVKTGLKKKNKTVLLIDEAHLLAFNNSESLRHLFECDELFSAVLCFDSSYNPNFSASFKQSIAEHLKLSRLSEDSLKQILATRLGDSNCLERDSVDFIAKNSNGNPKQFLVNCKKVFVQKHVFNSNASIGFENAKDFSFKKTGNCVVEKSALHKESVLENLTPLQRSILEKLCESPKSLFELSVSTGSSIGTIGKQLSILCLKTKRDYMARKGVTEPLVSKNKEARITMYSLTQKAENIL